MESQTKTTAIMTIPVKCILCGVDTMIRFDGVKYFAWRNGEGTIQRMLPELTDDERELLVTGLCTKHQPI